HVPGAEARLEFYRRKCLACHESRGCALSATERLERDANDSCVACHMPPSLELSNILHVSFADHRVLRQPRALPEGASKGSSTEFDLAVFDHADQRLPGPVLDRARALGLVRGTEHKARRQADAPKAEELALRVHRKLPDDTDILEALATACLMQGQEGECEEWCLKALEL